MLATKIERLTGVQEKRLIDFRAEWLAIGLSCEEADRPRAERAFSEMYRLLNRKPPIVVWMNSDLGCLFAYSTLWANLGANLWANLWANLGANLRDNLGANLGDNLWANLGANLRANLGDNLGANLWDNLRANLGANLWANLWANLGANLRDNLGANLGDNLWANLGANLRANLRANLGANLRDNLGANLRDNLGANLWANLGDKKISEQINKFFWGNHESWWIAYFIFPHWHLRKMYLEENAAKLNLWAEIARSCSWWLPFENVVFASNRPLEIHKDARTRLHNDNDMAVKFRDGWGLYSIHGVRVPAKYVLTKAEDIDSADVLKESNAEVRMAAISKIGFMRMLGKLPYEIVSTAPGGESLIQFNLNGQPVRGLHCIWEEGDGRHETVIPVWWRREQFGIDCPDNIDNAEQVRRWTLRLPKDAEIVAES